MDNNSLFSKFMHFFRGYVVIEVEGLFLEKFTNFCINNRINFWNVKKISNTKICLTTTIKEYKKMRKYVRKSRSRMKLISKKGLVFKTHKYRKRKIFLVGILFFLVIFKVLTSMVWQINVSGNETIKSKELISQLEELGLKKYKFKKSIDTFYINYKMMINRDDLSFITIKFDGVNANVEVIEKIRKPEIEAKDEVTNIVAKKTGIITEVNVLSGTKKVNVGDTVLKGDLLVEGIMEMSKLPEKTQRIHSQAEIKARIWYEEEQMMKIEGNLEVSEFEHFAYLIAYDKIKEQMDENAKIVDEKVSYSYGEDFIIAHVVIETIEEIGEQIAVYKNDTNSS